ncbi:MAG: SRPBCC family protein [Verrucomicrobiales bacterium]|nr:SRPBCC family protein [Verrucomicrobiales bacterium]
MPLIRLETRIAAPVDRVFDLARSIDAHSASTTGTDERAVAGRTSGLIERGETVTWEARHFGVRQKLTSRITEMNRPEMFVDEMVRGAFSSIRHVHRFEQKGDLTLMHDEFQFSAPLGILGRLAEVLFLTRYMERFLRKRNAVLKALAESDGWRGFLQ